LLPFNIASYALLAHIIGRLTNLTPLKLVGSLSKVHIYDNAMEKATEQLNNSVTKHEGAKLSFNISDYITPHVSLDELFNKFKLEDFKLNNYNSFSSLNVQMLSYNK